MAASEAELARRTMWLGELAAFLSVIAAMFRAFRAVGQAYAFLYPISGARDKCEATASSVWDCVLTEHPA